LRWIPLSVQDIDAMDVARRQFFITASVTAMSMVTIGVCAESTTAASPDTDFAFCHAVWKPSS
jgi:hypothetical protein